MEKVKLTFFSSSSFSSAVSSLGKKYRLYRIMEPFNNSCHHRVSGSTSWIAYYNQLAIGYLPSTTRNAVF